MLNSIRMIVIILLALATLPAAADGDPIYEYTYENPELVEAISGARQTLPLFFDNFNDAQTKGLDRKRMLLKVAIPYGPAGSGNNEHIWCHPIGFDAETGQYVGLLSNNPVHIPFAQYDQVKWEHAQITDWMYFDPDGKMHGAYTIRMIMKDMSSEDRAQYEAILAPLPET